MTDTNKEREAFEHALMDLAARHGELIGASDLLRDASGAYENGMTEIAWMLWQARASLAESAGSEPVAWPKDAAEVREFFNADFISAQFAAPDQSPCDDDRYYISAHDFLSAINWWADFPHHPSPPEGAGWMQVYRCKIKPRKQIDREIPREQQGWWADVAAGQKLLLRQAVQSDLDRCTLGGKRSKNPADYMCETHTNGSLVSKVALEYMNPEENVFAAAPPASEAKGA